MEDEKTEDTIPETTDKDLEGGMFNMMISLAHYHMARGLSQKQACEKVADYLEALADGMRAYK